MFNTINAAIQQKSTSVNPVYFNILNGTYADYGYLNLPINDFVIRIRMSLNGTLVNRYSTILSFNALQYSTNESRDTCWLNSGFKVAYDKNINSIYLNVKQKTSTGAGNFWTDPGEYPNNIFFC